MQNKTEHLWNELINVREYFRKELVATVGKSKTFGGENATPIIKAYNALEQSQPFIDKEIYQKANSSIMIAQDQFNTILACLRDNLTGTATIDDLNLILKKAEKKYTESLEDVKKLIPNSGKVSQVTNAFHIEKNYGNAGGTILESHITNIENFTLSYLLSKIEESDISEEEKNTLKDKLNEFISHPLLTSILGGAVGGIL